MIDSLIVRPLLRVTTWVKRHPLLALLAVVILFLLPPVIIVLTWILNSVLGLVGTIAAAVVGAEKAKEIAEKVYQAFSKFLTWLSDAPHRCYWVALAVGLFMPLAGVALAAWCFLDRFKTGDWKASLKLDNRSETPAPATPIEPPTPDISETSPEVPPDFQDVFQV